ncbi:MAG TPA: sulfate permease [Alphaproteobacteria bacterium]
MSTPARTDSPQWHLFVPKLFTVLRLGYTFDDFRADVIAGLTVAIVALPLAMALAIASGTTPDRGLYTAIVAGFLTSFLGGSRYQIGGPTGAFVVVVFNVIQQHGYDGLVIATIMAGLMLLVFGFARLGTFIKYIPHPVVTGFTAGIAVIIFSSQVKDLLGLSMQTVPADFIPKWKAFIENIGSFDPAAFGIAAGTLTVIFLIRRYKPSLPAFLIGVIFGSAAVAAFGLPIETIGSRFGGIPNTLPTPSLPEFGIERIIELVPSAFTIALLSAIESLLCAVVADGMTGRKHRSNCELVAQGVANIASAVMGGIPATGAIARTATNIRSGARSPVAGMMHAVFLLLFMVALAPLASYIPLASLAAVLVVVAWNMSEHERFRHLMSAPAGDRVVMLLTFALTVLVDLTVGIQVGVLLAAVLFMHRMAEAVEVQNDIKLIMQDEDDFTRPATQDMRRQIPPDVEVFQLNGPFFFGATARLGDVLNQIRQPPRVFILRMRNVPVIDASGVAALSEFLSRCRAQGTRVILSGLQPVPRRVLDQMGVRPGPESFTLAPDFEAALRMAREGDAEIGLAAKAPVAAAT